MASVRAGPVPAPIGLPTARTESAATQRPGHRPALDGIRGLAILMVMSYHIFQAEPVPKPFLLRVAYSATSLGWTGVDLFFVLSGFLITGILHDLKGSPNYFVNFYGRRALRIFPLYFGFALIVIDLVPRFLGFRVTSISWLTLATFSANFGMLGGGEAGMLGHYWSLAIEEQFYLIWPFFVFAIDRAALMRICLAAMAASAALRWVVACQGVSPHMMTSCRIDTLLVGALLALSARGPQDMAAWARRIVWFSLAAPPTAVLLHAALGGSGSAWLQVVKYPIIAAPCAALLAVAVTASPGSVVGRILTLGPLCRLGRYSYGLYIYHQAVIDVLRWMIGPAGEASPVPPLHPMWSPAVRVPLFFVVPYAVAWVSWHAFERPILSLKRYFEYEPRRRPRPRTISVAGETSDAQPLPAGLAVHHDGSRTIRLAAPSPRASSRRCTAVSGRSCPPSIPR